MKEVVLLTELAERVAMLEAEAENFKDWQKKQNSSLQRLEAKVDRIYFWLIGLMGGMITSLILLIISIYSGR
jgi:hypothetical protein